MNSEVLQYNLYLLPIINGKSYWDNIKKTHKSAEGIDEINRTVLMLTAII